MRKALLVLGATSPKGLDRLVQACAVEDYTFYAHIDAKIDLGDYKSRIRAASSDRVTFLPSRFPVYWGGFNMIRATLGLLQAASDDDCQHFTLLSDDSFWLQSPATYAQACLETPNRIDQLKIDDKHPKYRRYKGLFHFDGPAFSARHIKAEDRQIDLHGISAVYEDLLILRELGKPEIDLRMGSQWWSLSRAAVDHILKVAASNRNLIRSFQYSAIPDEMFFQTLSAEVTGPVPPAPMYVDFSRDPKPFVFRRASDINPAEASGKFFIRKVDPDSEIVMSRLASS